MKNIQKDYRIILASASPRRRELLSQIGLVYECIPSGCEEITTKTAPGEIVEELSLLKARDIARHFCNSIGKIAIIGADTVVALDGKIMGKPEDREDSFRMLKSLQGKEHSVFTGVSLIFIKDGHEERVVSFYEETKVWMYSMNDAEIWEYIDTNEPEDKAGSYAIQGKCAAYVERIEGDFNSVVGLPISRICKILREQ